MSLFSRKKEVIVNNICPVCSTMFSNSERTLRHITRAHKPKKKFDCNPCEFRN